MIHTSQNTSGPKSTYVLWSFFTPSNNKHRYILSLSMQFGWSKPHKVTGKDVTDLAALDKWLRGKNTIGQSPVCKPLNDMTPTELSKVITALENMVTKKHSK